MTTTPVPQSPTTKPRRRWPWAVAVLVALFVGVGVGNATGTSDPEAATPQPTVTVTAEPVVETVTETVEVESTECRDYALWLLQQNDTIHGIFQDVLSEMATILDRDGYMIVSEYVAIVERATDQVNDLADEISSGRTFDC